MDGPVSGLARSSSDDGISRHISTLFAHDWPKMELVSIPSSNTASMAKGRITQPSWCLKFRWLPFWNRNWGWHFSAPPQDPTVNRPNRTTRQEGDSECGSIDRSSGNQTRFITDVDSCFPLPPSFLPNDLIPPSLSFVLLQQ